MNVTSKLTNFFIIGFCLQLYSAVSWEASSFLGGANEDIARDTAFDSAGNIYITGGTFSPTFPTTPGAYDTTHNGGSDVYIVKLDPTGKTILASTLIGSSTFQRGYGIKVDADGFVYLGGRTGSGFPVTQGSFQTTFNATPNTGGDGVTNAFVAKLSGDLSTLIWASYFGVQTNTGAANDYIGIVRDLAIDSFSNVYISTGHNGGVYPPLVAVAILNGPPMGGPDLNNKDAVLAKISSDGTHVEWLRYFGGTGRETMQSDVVVNANNEIYFFTLTNSSDIPTTLGAYDTTFNGGVDGYLAKVSTSGDVVWATYIGGTGNEGMEKNVLALDLQGNPHLALLSNSPDFPTLVNSYDKNFNGSGGTGLGAASNYGHDVVVAKLSSQGNALLASTYLGGRYGDGPEGIAVDALGKVWVTGGTYSDNFPTTTDAIQRNLGAGLVGRGNVDAFLVGFDPDLSMIHYGTYQGGKTEDYGRTISVNSIGTLIFSGQTKSSGFPTKNAVDPSFNLSFDSFFTVLTTLADRIPNQIAAGWRHTCALDASDVECWGYNAADQTSVPPSANPIAISVESNHSCVLSERHR